MLYNNVVSGDAVQLPRGMLMPPPQIVTEYDRQQKFKLGENSMDGFHAAGCLSSQRTQIQQAIRATQDCVQKVKLFGEYLSSSARQMTSIILNGNLRSSSTEYSTKYLKQGEVSICHIVTINFASYHILINPST